MTSKPAPNHRDEAQSLAALYGAGDATDDREAGRLELTRLMSGRTEERR